MNAERLYRLGSTCFGIGFLTAMPGTLASAAAFLFYILLPVPPWAVLVVGAAGVVLSGRYARSQMSDDPSEVVIDEVVGTWAAMTGLPPGLGLPALFLFRVFDIVKPFPVNKAEKLPGGFGIMADDIVAAFYANLLVRAVRWLFLAGGLAAFYERIF